MTQIGKHFWPNFAFINGIRIDYLSPTFYLIDILLLAYLPFLFLEKIDGDKLKKNKLKIFLLFLLLFLFFNFVISLNKSLWFYRLYQYIRIIEVFYIFLTIDKKNLRYFMLGLGFSLIFSTLLSILQIFNQGSINGIFWFFGERSFNIFSPNIATISLNGEHFLRPYATFSHPNSLAGFALVSGLLFLFMHWWWFFYFAFILVILSFSKITIFISLLLLLGYWLWLKRNKWQLLFIIIPLFTVSVLFLCSVWKGNPESLSERVLVWKEAFVQISQNPLGLGLGSYFFTLKQNAFGFLLNQPVHNIFLVVLLEVGIPFFIYILWLLKKIYKTSKKSVFVLIIATGIIFTGLFDHYWLTLIQNQLLLGVILGLIFGQKFLSISKTHH